MIKLSNHSGFGVLEALLILVLIGVLGFTGWFVYRAQKTADKSYNSQSSAQLSTTKKAIKSVDTYAGWKAFCSGVTNACFKYDPSWTFAECEPQQINMQNFQDCAPEGGEMVSLISPDKLDRIDWSVVPYDASVVNQCTQGRTSYPGVSYSGITQVPNASNVYYVDVTESPNGTTFIGDPKYDSIDHIALTTGLNGHSPTLGQEGALCPVNPSFLSRDGKYQLAFSYDYDVNTSPNIPTSDRSYPPLQAVLSSVKKTLLSFHYK